ncbi:citrate lyase holo-[acyl-carrier protein] synthase [Sulfurospirillum arcachonense]|uniref:citrate lyase holo-[acyl-carrier protein] synthase n=1 Tax=Sulfurospirillum arcachonense TaxID=57666 RepID=UPI000468B483|nr:citrate lyase holo-[acyl-carrier protein] synthase [Sulfurospirillum arcachonense]
MKLNNWLNRVLENRELRQKKQWEFIERYNSPVLSLTINIPGADKLSPDAQFIYGVALKEIDLLGLQEIDKNLICKQTGCEALFSFKTDAQKLKLLTCKIEETHPLGRFMDIDVIDEHKKILSRKVPRKCYICDTNAKECARSQKHSITQLLDFISKTVDDYKISL